MPVYLLNLVAFVPDDNVVNILYNQKICITYMVRIQLNIFTQNSTLGIQLHVSALYVGHRQVVL